MWVQWLLHIYKENIEIKCQVCIQKIIILFIKTLVISEFSNSIYLIKNMKGKRV